MVKLPIDGEAIDVNWRDRAICSGEREDGRLYSDLLFPIYEADEPESKRICDPCPVKAECLIVALVSNSQYGIWGGKTYPERRAWAKTPPARQMLREYGEKLRPASVL